MKRGIIYTMLVILLGAGCTSSRTEEVADKGEALTLTLEQASRLAALPLACMQTDYPNKLGQTLGSKTDMGEPQLLHPAFYGCFDWHSAVHAHWSLVKLLKLFPELEEAPEIRKKLKENISAANILSEVEYFKRITENSYERTYGWIWLLKLAEELHTWNDPLALIESRVRDFYLGDIACPMTWEPSGYDFLSPCLEEIDLMRRVLDQDEFHSWMEAFAPQLLQTEYELEVGRVSDRSDGKLVHLDGLNFSRAWVLYGLAHKYPEYKHLLQIADEHVAYSLPNLVGDSYEGGHWLGSFALYALQLSK